MGKEEGLLGGEDEVQWLPDHEDDGKADNYGQPSFPDPPLTPSTPALPTSLWVAVVGVGAQIICVMTFGGSDSTSALLTSTLICTLMILGGSLDCLFNSPIAFNTTGLGLTFKIVTLCLAVGTFVCGLAGFGWLFFSEGYNSEYRVDYARTLRPHQDVFSADLPNGLKYTVKANDFEPGLFSTVLAVDTGSTNEDETQKGLAHFLEHMAFDSSFHFPARGNVYSEVMKFGADFNAFTNFRNTVYFFHKLEFTEDNLRRALFLHKNQVMYQNPVESHIDQERGAVLGEARLHNHTSRWAMNSMVCNHFGEGHRGCSHFPIGLPEQIALFRPTDFRAYLTQWYRLDKMRLFVVGDFAGREKDVEAIVSEVFGKEQYLDGQHADRRVENKPIAASSAIEPGRVFIEEYAGLDGVDLHLIVTDDYATPMSSVEVVRLDTWNDVFESLFKSQVLARFGSMYPEQLLQGTGITHAHASVSLDWSFNCTMYSLTIATPGKPHRSTWKRDLEVALKELKVLAEDGPDPDAVADAMAGVLADATSEHSKKDKKPHETVIMDLLGNLDPAFAPVCPDDEFDLVSSLLTSSMQDAVSLHVQTCAQVLYRAMLECTANTTYNAEPYTALSPMRASLNVFHGTTATRAFLKKITRENIARIVAGVHMQPQEPVTTAGLQVMFMLPALLTHHSNTAQDLRESDFLLSFPQDPKGPEAGGARLVDDHNATNVKRYVLSNGIGVNVRPPTEAEQDLVQKGYAVIEVVALGGLSTQTDTLKGGCQFINTVKANGLSLARATADSKEDNKPSLNLLPQCHAATWARTAVGTRYSAARVQNAVCGRVHHPDTHRDPGDQQPEKRGDEEGLQCESEFMRIPATLSAKCGYDEECDPANRDYSQSLKYVLDEMRPQYDERTVKLAYREHEKQLETLELDVRTSDVMDRTIIPSLVEVAYPNDPRTARLTLNAMKELDPLEVNRWVREHFAIGRFEINIAGDVHIENTVKQLDEVFGVLPNITFSQHIGEDNITAGVLHRVGLDPYDADDVVHFSNRRFPNSKLRLACVLRSPTPNHAHIMHMVPGGDFRSGGRPIVRRVSDRVLSRMLFLSVRRDNGFAYHVDLTPRHSIVYPNFGYYHVEWVAGKYSTYNAESKVVRPQFRADLNVPGSALVVRDTFNRTVPQDTFEEVMSTFVQRINSSSSDPHYWLGTMQGLSIRPPATWPPLKANATLPGLVHLDDVDELAALGTVSKADVDLYLKSFVSDPQRYLLGIVTTRERSYGLQPGETECSIPVGIV